MEQTPNHPKFLREDIREDIKNVESGHLENAGIMKHRLEEITREIEATQKKIEEKGINKFDKNRLEVYVNRLDAVVNAVKDLGEGKLDLP